MIIFGLIIKIITYMFNKSEIFGSKLNEMEYCHFALII